jgi:hypothetical protein
MVVFSLSSKPASQGRIEPGHSEAAAQMEMDLAEDLRRAGFTVAGGH